MKFASALSLSMILLMIFINQSCATTVPSLSSAEGAPVNVVTYQYPRIVPKNTDIKFTVNDTAITLVQTTAGPFASFSCDGPVRVTVEIPVGTPSHVYIAPKSYGIEATLQGQKLTFTLPGPSLVAVMAGEHPLLFVYANPLENNPPSPNDPNVLYYKAGQVYEVGDLNLKSDQTLFIEAGAVVRGAINASNASNVRIAGYGVLDGSYFTGRERRRSILFENCRNSVIEDIIMIEPTSWMILLGLSDSITVRNIKQLGSVTTTDGVDVVGSRHVRIENSFLRNGDDCVAIKSFNIGRYESKATLNYSRTVYDVEVTGCIMLSYLGGHAFEIGHELTTDSIYDIRFRNCDVLGVHGHGGVFGINNSDRAVVTNILYEDIRVEHYYNKLVNLRVIKSRFFTDERRGQVRNITFKDIRITNSPYNPGYSSSLIGGYDENHTVENVLFDNVTINGIKVTNADQIDLFTRQARNIVFK